MNVERNLPIVRERKNAILKGDPELCAEQKKAGKASSWQGSASLCFWMRRASLNWMCLMQTRAL